MHKALVGAKSSVLATLSADIDAQEEVCLWDGTAGGGAGGGIGGAAGQLPEAVRSVEHFGLFLKEMYGCGTGVASVGQALALIDQADYWACPSVLLAADAFLAVTTLNGKEGICCLNEAGDPRGRTLATLFQRASKHKLRRCSPTGSTAAGLPATVSFNFLLADFLQAHGRLPAPPLAVTWPDSEG